MHVVYKLTVNDFFPLEYINVKCVQKYLYAKMADGMLGCVGMSVYIGMRAADDVDRTARVAVCRGRLVDLESGVISKVVVELKRELVPVSDMLVECALPCVLSVKRRWHRG